MNISEKLGVPKHIEKAGQYVYDEIISRLRDLPDHPEYKLIAPNTYRVELDDIMVKIGDKLIDGIELGVYIKIDNSSDGVNFLGATINTNLGVEKDNETRKLYMFHGGFDDGFELNIRLLVSKDIFEKIGSMDYICDMLEKKLDSSVITHELMHLYHNSKSDKASIKSVSDYMAVTNMNNFGTALNIFTHLLYFTTMAENSVRASELYHKLKKGGITKSDFKEFFDNDKIVHSLKQATYLTLKGIKDSIEEDGYTGKLLDSLEKIGFDRSEDKVYDIMKLYFIDISSKSLRKSAAIIEDYGDIEMVDKSPIGKIVIQKDQERTMDILVKTFSKYENNIEKFFEDSVKKINRTGTYMLKKLAKLYDMLDESEETKSVSNWKLHQKINSRNEDIQFIPNFLDYIKESRSEFLRWKRKNVTIRGVREMGKPNGVYGSFGKGIYTVPLSNKKMAKEYGEAYFVVNAKPSNPKIVQYRNDAEILIQNLVDRFCEKHNVERSNKFFDDNTTIEDEMVKLGYDGIEIKGREMVKYFPENILYFKTERELEQYYIYVVSKNNEL